MPNKVMRRGESSKYRFDILFEVITIVSKVSNLDTESLSLSWCYYYRTWDPNCGGIKAVDYRVLCKFPHKKFHPNKLLHYLITAG